MNDQNSSDPVRKDSGLKQIYTALEFQCNIANAMNPLIGDTDRDDISYDNTGEIPQIYTTNKTPRT